ncbi:MAG: SufE family protein [Epsilonproteobacteria bacterium]|nr:SufE family protein [Campylobacterota bacterium]
MIKEKIQKYKADLELFETPQEKIEYIIDLGKEHKKLDESLKNEKSYINGCASDAWLVAECKDDRIYYKGEGTSELAKGMMVMLLDIFNGAKVDEILDFDMREFKELGIMDLLSPLRLQSLEAFIKKVKEYAKMCKEIK